MTSVTLAGTHLTDPDTEFVYHGESSACGGCPYHRRCLNLIEGVRYRVLGARENTQILDCAIHDRDVRAVEVEPAPVTMNVPSKGAYAGNKASLQDLYPYTECPSHGCCIPKGVKLNQEYRIHDILSDPPHNHCHLDRNLTLVEFEPVDEQASVAVRATDAIADSQGGRRTDGGNERTD